MSVINVKSEPTEQYYLENGDDMPRTTTHNISAGDGISFIVKEEFGDGMEEQEHPSQILPDCLSPMQYFSEEELSDNSEASAEPSTSSKRSKRKSYDDTVVGSKKPKFTRREKVQRKKSKESSKTRRKDSIGHTTADNPMSNYNHTVVESHMDSLNDLKSLLKSWNLSHLNDYFEEERITMYVLKIITKDDLPELTKNMKIGDKFMFKYHFEKWRAANSEYRFSPPPASSTSSSSQSCHSDGEAEKSKEKEKIKTIDILKQHNQGCLILEIYKKTEKITEEQRNMLINIIVQHFESKDIKMTMQISRRIEEEILKIFPTEKIQFYRTGSRGKIYIKFHNNSKRLFKTFKTEAKTNAANSSPNSKHLKKFVPEPDAAVHIQSLENGNLSSEEFMTKWDACAKFRLNQIHYQCKNINEALDHWPQYKLANGFQLINKDFYAINDNILIQLEWNGKFRKLLEFVRTQLKRYIKDFLPCLTDDCFQKDCDGTMMKILWFLHYHLYPTKKYLRTNENGEKEYIRPSSKDSQESFLYINETMEGLRSHINDLSRKSEAIQPFILGVGEPKTLIVTEFFLYLGGKLIQFSTFSTAFDICFKSYHVFNVDYPIASVTFWTFIEKFLYDVSRSDHQNSKVCILIDELTKM